MKKSMLVFILAIFLALPLFAQDYGQLTGSVNASGGDFIEGAEITVSLLTPDRDPGGGCGGGCGGG